MCISMCMSFYNGHYVLTNRFWQIASVASCSILVVKTGTQPGDSISFDILELNKFSVRTPVEPLNVFVFVY